jgi:hypothetical protein
LFDLPVDLSIKILKIAAKKSVIFSKIILQHYITVLMKKTKKKLYQIKKTIEYNVDFCLDYDVDNYFPYYYTKIINSYGKYILKDPTFEHTIANYIYYSNNTYSTDGKT